MDPLPDDLKAAFEDMQPGTLAQQQQAWQAIYAELRRLARYRLRQHQPGQTFSTTVLVHEVYLKLRGAGSLQINDHAHFLALSSRAMRQILVQHLRQKGALKRISGAVTLDEHLGAIDFSYLDVLALDEALTELEAVDKRMVQVVDCRFFGGLSNEETAKALGVSSRSVERFWQKAKMLLHKKLQSL